MIGPVMIDFLIIIIPFKSTIKQLSSPSQAWENIDDSQPINKLIYGNEKINYKNNPQGSWSEALLEV